MVRILFLLFISSFLFLTPFHASAQEERAAPRSGEGISAFLQRNKRPGKAYYLEFLELNKKQLRGKQELHLGVKYLLPPLKSKTETAAIHLLLLSLLPVPAKQFMNLFSEKNWLKSG